MSPIRVLLADDHPVVREGIRDLLSQDVTIQVVGEAADGLEALELTRRQEPDVLVLDLEMPRMNGFQLIERISSENLDVKILVLSAHASQEYVRILIEQGIAGYLMKEEALDKIVEAVLGVAHGQNGWFSRRITARIPEAVKPKEKPFHRLTKREKDVLEEVVRGKTNQEIGVALGISVKTVEKHLESIFRKLEVESRVEAAVWAAERELP